MTASAPKPPEKVEPAAVPAEVKKKGCATMIAFLLALAAVASSTVVFLLAARG